MAYTVNLDVYMSSLNPTKSLTREEFYTLVFKTEEGVQELDIDEDFAKAVGGPTNFTKFAQYVVDDGFLQVSNKSLDETTYKGKITRAEAIYLIINRHFKDKLEAVTGKEEAFKDTKNAGDLALKLKFKEKINGEIVAKGLGLIEGNESRWDQPLSKAEALDLIIRTQLKKNELYGYLSEVERGMTNVDKFYTYKQVDNNYLKVIGIDEDGLAYGEDWTEEPRWARRYDLDTEVEPGMTVADLKEIIKQAREIGERYNYTEEEVEELIDNCVGYYLERTGLTVEIIESMEEEPSTGGSSTGGSTGGGSSGTGGKKNDGYTRQFGVPGTFPPTDWDKDRDGIDDVLQKSISRPTGTDRDPNFGLKSD